MLIFMKLRQSSFDLGYASFLFTLYMNESTDMETACCVVFYLRSGSCFRAGSRRKCFVDASGKMSKAPRRIETKYWLEDKEKDKKRKQMTAKLFKGRKKVKFGSLSQKAEEKLLRIIASKDDIIYDEEKDSTKSKGDAEEGSTTLSKGRSKNRGSKEPLQATEKEVKRPSESPKKSVVILPEIIISEEPSVEPEQSDPSGVEHDQSSGVVEEHLNGHRYSDELAWAPLPKDPAQRPIDETTVSSTFNGEKSSVKSNKRRSSRRRSSIFKPVNRATKDDEEKEVRVSLFGIVLVQVFLRSSKLTNSQSLAHSFNND